MKITSLELRNLKNFGNYTFDRFDSNGLTAITGDVGSGKTILVKAVAFALGATQETLCIQNWNSFVNCYTYDSSVTLTFLLDNNRKVNLEKRITRNGIECFFNQKRVREETYTKKLESLKIRDHYFLPILNETINRLGDDDKEYASFFEAITGTNEESLECDEARESLEREAKILDEHKKYERIIDLERYKTTELYLARLFFCDERIRLKENEINEKKMCSRKLKTATGGDKVSLTKTMKAGRASKTNPGETQKSVEVLKTEKFQLYAERHFYLRQCQINKIILPTGSRVVCVLSSDELRCRDDPTSPFSTALLEEKRKFTPDEVEKGIKMVINHDPFKQNLPTTSSVESIDFFCNMLLHELQLIKSDLPEELKKMALIKKEAICQRIIIEKESRVETLEESITDLTIQRRNTLLDFIDAVNDQLEREYEDLRCDDMTRGAILNVSDPENPWDSVTIILKDRNTEMNFGSANPEIQKIANIALLFAMAKVKGSSFVFIDAVTESVIDRKLDTLISYLKKKSETFQVVTTSLTSTSRYYLRQAGVATQNI
ncbi:unnamed protein product [Caenorhabditis brenneri]